MLSEMMSKMGLGSKEAKIYLTTLKLGSQPASTIAKHSNINRVTVYDTFEKLIQKGLATKTDKGRATYFQVLSPKNLLNYLEREKNEFERKIEKQKAAMEEILPAIISLENPTSTKPKIRFYEGDKGMREAAEDILNATTTIRAYINVETLIEFTGYPNSEFYKRFYDHKKKAGIIGKVISPDNKVSIERSTRDKEESRETRFIPKEEYPFTVSELIYNNKIITLSRQENMAVMIESKEIADLHKKIFDLVWKTLK